MGTTPFFSGRRVWSRGPAWHARVAPDDFAKDVVIEVSVQDLTRTFEWRRTVSLVGPRP